MTIRINEALDLCCPREKIILKPGNNLYLGSDTREAQARRDAERANNTGEYRRLRNLASKLVRRDRLLSNLRRVKEDPNAAWQIANEAMGKSKSSGCLSLLKGHTTDLSCAESINQFFITKAEKIRSDLGTDTGPPHVPTPVDTSDLPPDFKLGHSLSKISEEDTLKLIQSLNNKKSLGHDSIPVLALKLGATFLAGPAMMFINSSLINGIVPQVCKLVDVAPLHKKKEKDQMKNYRPVALTTAISKLLEAAFLNQMSPYLDKVLATEQHGYRPGRSVASAVTSATSLMSGAILRKESFAVAMFDFSGAFDSAALPQLLMEARAVGLDESYERWITSWLSDRKQRVRWNFSFSPYLEVKLGLPQGTLTGPCFFNLLTRSLPVAFRTIPEKLSMQTQVKTHCKMFADDVNAIATHRLVSQALKTLSAQSDVFSETARRIGLALNTEKTQLVVHSASTTTSPLSISIAGKEIKAQREGCMLGVSFNDRVSLNLHLNTLIGDMRSRVGLIRRIAANIPSGALLRQIATAIIHGKLASASIALPCRLEETDPVSGPARELQVLQNDMACILTRSKRIDRIPIPVLLKKAEITSVNGLLMQAAGTVAWKASCPVNVLHTEVFSDNMPASTRLRANNLLRPTPPGNTAPLIASAIAIWNSSPELRAAPTLLTAKVIAKKLATTAPI